MHTIAVYFDLKNPASDYALLEMHLKTYSGYTRAGERLWFINTEDTTASVRDELKGVLPSNQVLLIFEVGEHWSTDNVNANAQGWFHSEWKP